MSIPFILNQNAKALKSKKEEGNQAFKNNNYEAAYQLYTEALKIDPNNIKTNAKLYCNRATAGAKVKGNKSTCITVFCHRLVQSEVRENRNNGKHCGWTVQTRGLSKYLLFVKMALWVHFLHCY